MIQHRLIAFLPVFVLTTSLFGCGGTDAAPNTNTSTNNSATLAQKAVKAYIQQNLADLVASSKALSAAAPMPDADGWNAKDDAAALEAMRSEWKKARIAYEHIEGAIAVLFPELDRSTDERYDGFLAEELDENLFDDQGVTGIHAIERILWADKVPAAVVDFESKLGGYKPAAFPKTMVEADAFRNKLCARLLAEVTQMHDDLAPLDLDLSAALYGVKGSMKEQVEKMNRASLGAEESRYAQFTLADMRANVEGGKAIYLAFQPWMRADAGGAAIDAQVTAGFARVTAAYATLPGDALPEKPATWSSTPSEADKATPFGKVWVVVNAEGDATSAGSLAEQMTQAGAFLKLQEP